MESLTYVLNFKYYFMFLLLIIRRNSCLAYTIVKTFGSSRKKIDKGYPFYQTCDNSFNCPDNLFVLTKKTYIFSINCYIHKQFLYYDFIYKLELSKYHESPNCIYNENLPLNKAYCAGYKKAAKN